MADPLDNEPSRLLRRALAGDERALAALFDAYREQLRRMIRLRVDRRLFGRVDSSGEILSCVPGLKEHL
jgi:RNA polymerase sigma-70 factor (ECF subfamily)